MQAQTPEVSAEKATTPDEQRLVSVELLKKIHRDLDACQKVIWLAGCRPHGYGFDPSYVTDAQERLKEIETLIVVPAPAQDERQSVRVTAVAVTREDEDGQLYLGWQLEGGIAELEFAGQVLLVADQPITDDEGSGEVYAAPIAQTAPLVVPDECPHIIVFDDADRENEMFAGCGARPAAMRRWEQISQSWNAHLFVRIEKNSRDAPYPCATAAPQPEQEPFWYAVVSEQAPSINSAIKRLDVAQEFADSKRERWPDTRVVPLYTAPQPEQSGWISVEDRLPEVAAGDEGEFIVCVYRSHNGESYSFSARFLNDYPLHTDYEDEPALHSGWYDVKEHADYDGWYSPLIDEKSGDKVTHWMPLPAAPAPLAKGGE